MQIQNNPQLIVISASAGSGKTRALALRYLDLLLNPNFSEKTTIGQILAITFTKKATYEMKERILTFLKAIALGPRDEESKRIIEDLKKSLNFSLENAQNKAHEVLKEIFEKYNFFQISTIDSFVNSLVFACSLNLGLSAELIMEKNHEELLKLSLDELIDKTKSSEKILKVFKNFLRQYLFVENKASWYPKEEIYRKIKELFEKINIYGSDFCKINDEKNLIILSQIILKDFNRLLKILPDGVSKNFKNSLEKIIESSEEYFYLKSNGQEFLLKEEIPLNKGFKPSKKANNLWGKIKKNIQKLVELEARQKFSPYIKIFKQVEEFFQEIKKRENLIFLVELNYLAQQIFTRGVSIPEIYYRLATRFYHYLIDEFQDTSVLQWQNLYPLIEEALSVGGTFFYVGDKKQSIYRFRGGEVSLFDQIPKWFANYFSGFKVLNQNFRSFEEIINFNNEIFSEGNLKRLIKKISEEKDLELSFKLVKEIFEDAIQNPGAKNQLRKGFVAVNFIDFSNQEERDQKVKEKLIPLVKNLLERNCQEIAILCRENNDVELISFWLLENGIKVESDKTLNVRENPLIKEIISFLKFLDSPIDDLAFANFISGKILRKSCGINIKEIQKLIFENRISKTKAEPSYLYKIFQKKFPEVWREFFEEFFKNVGFLNLYELLVSIYQKFEVNTHFYEFQGYFLKLLELVKNNEDKNDISSFLEIFEEMPEEELYLTTSDVKAVKVLTIHKAKGLQFEVVILPFLELVPKVGREGVIFQNENNELELLQLRKIYINFSEKIRNYYLKEYHRSLIDELNTLYVALTRAKCEMHIFVPEKAGNQKNFAWFFINDEPYNFERGKKVEFKELKEKQPGFLVSPPHYKNWVEFIKEEFPDFYHLKYRRQQKKGEILHFIFSKIINFDENFMKSFDEIVKEAFERFGEIGDIEEYKKIVKEICQSKKTASFFQKTSGQIFTEIEVVDLNGNTFRIDRLIINKDEIKIIDFKSSQEDKEKKVLQLKNYGKILKQINPEKKVLGYLIYFDTFEIENIYKI